MTPWTHAQHLVRDEWGLAELEARLVGVESEADRWRRRVASGAIAYTGHSRVKMTPILRYPPPPAELTPDESSKIIARFRREVPLERAMLASRDPEGEAGAVAPLSEVRARQVMLEAAEELARTTRPRLTIVPGYQDRRESGRDLLSRLGCDPTRASGVLRCPAHEDRSPSLSWRLAANGTALMHCHAGCTFEAILAAIA